MLTCAPNKNLSLLGYQEGLWFPIASCLYQTVDKSVEKISVEYVYHSTNIVVINSTQNLEPIMMPFIFVNSLVKLPSKPVVHK